MPSEKHQQKAREIVAAWMKSGAPVRDRIAAALEATERETANRCGEIARNEMVDAEDAGELTDAAYNHACVDIQQAIRAEFGITEKEATR